MFRLGFIPVLFIGISIGAIIFTWGFFWNYQPDIDEATAIEQHAVALQQNANQGPAAAKRVNQAADMVTKVEQQWAAIVARRTPPASLTGGGINMAVNAWQMTIDVRTFRNSIQKALNKQLKAGGVKVINGPTIPMPSDDASTVVADFFNYPAIPFPVVIFDLGQITVQGSYDQIKKNVESWSFMPNYLAVADGLALTGTAPILTGTYNLSMVGYIRGKEVYPTVQQAGGATGAAGGGIPLGNGAPGAGGPGGAGPGRRPGGRMPGGPGGPGGAGA